MFHNSCPAKEKIKHSAVHWPISEFYCGKLKLGSIQFFLSEGIQFTVHCSIIESGHFLCKIVNRLLDWYEKNEIFTILAFWTARLRLFEVRYRLLIDLKRGTWLCRNRLKSVKMECFKMSSQLKKTVCGGPSEWSRGPKTMISLIA